MIAQRGDWRDPKRQTAPLLETGLVGRLVPDPIDRLTPQTAGNSDLCNNAVVSCQLSVVSCQSSPTAPCVPCLALPRHVHSSPDTNRPMCVPRSSTQPPVRWFVLSAYSLMI